MGQDTMKEVAGNAEAKVAQGITLTAEQAAAFKKFQEAQVKAAKYTVKQAMMIARAKAAGLEPTDAEVDTEYAKRQAKNGKKK